MEVEKVEKNSGEVVDVPAVVLTSSIENNAAENTVDNNSIDETQEIELSGHVGGEKATLDEIRVEAAAAAGADEKFEIENKQEKSLEKDNKMPLRCDSNVHVSMSPIGSSSEPTEQHHHRKRLKLDWFYILPIFYFCLPAFVSVWRFVYLFNLFTFKA